ncbi:MAG TPA: hypothetical protein VGE05_14960 [Novosphingobium sp.]
MRSMRALLLLPLALAGCGGKGGEDFQVEVKRPPVAVVVPFTGVDIREAQVLFPGLQVQRTRPSENEILYTIPGTGGAPSTVLLRFEPLRGGEATVVHATVEVPAIKMNIDGARKVLSEMKVERALKSLIETTADDLEMGSAGAQGSARFSQLLLSLAVATNEKYLHQALEMRDDPERLIEALMAFGDSSVDGETAQAGTGQPQDDPEAAALRDEAAHARSEYKEQAAAEDASRAQDDAQGQEGAEPMDGGDPQ